MQKICIFLHFYLVVCIKIPTFALGFENEDHVLIAFEKL